MQQLIENIKDPIKFFDHVVGQDIFDDLEYKRCISPVIGTKTDISKFSVEDVQFILFAYLDEENTYPEEYNILVCLKDNRYAYMKLEYVNNEDNQHNFYCYVDTNFDNMLQLGITKRLRDHIGVESKEENAYELTSFSRELISDEVCI